jgi:hypothetical protein
VHDSEKVAAAATIFSAVRRKPMSFIDFETLKQMVAIVHSHVHGG